MAASPKPSDARWVDDRLRRKNRVLGMLLASLAGLVLVAAISLAVLLHYVEAHHLIAKL
jgi:hypothetical protein